MKVETRVLYIIVSMLLLGGMYLTLEMGRSEGRLEKMEEWKSLAYPDAPDYDHTPIDTTDNINQQDL